MEETKKKKHKAGRIILLVILLLIAAIAALICYHSARNTKEMHAVIAGGLETVGEFEKVTPLDAGEFTDIKMNGIMKFHVDQYEVEDFGNLSVMTTNMVFMQMATFTLTPFEKNAPLCTFDYMYIMGNRKSYAEFYDLAADSEREEYTAVIDSLREMSTRYSDLEDVPYEGNWYDDLLSVFLHKKLPAKEEQRNRELFSDALTTYMTAVSALPQNSAEEVAVQVENTKAYSDGLIEKGGVSTDVFKQALGEETTRDFFDTTFFGTALYADPAQS